MMKRLLPALILLVASPTLFAAEIIVTTLDDNMDSDGMVTLREAILAANTDTAVDGSMKGDGADVIRFAPGLGGGAIPLMSSGDGTAGSSAFGILTDITIEGDRDLGITLELSSGAQPMRFFYVASGGSLSLKDLTLRGGRANGGGGGGSQRGGQGGGAAGMGGAVFNQGSLAIQGCTLVDNQATGGDGSSGAGGGSPSMVKLLP